MRKSVALLVSLTLCTLAVPSWTRAAEQIAPATVHGTLIDGNGQPLAGYRVKLIDETGTAFESAPTGADGKFQVSDLPPGKYRYELIDPEGKVIETQLPTVELTAGMSLTQPIAIVPRGMNKGKKHLVAWLVGLGAAAGVAAIAISNGNDDSNDQHDKSMTPSAAAGG